jgi:myosin-5
MLNNLLLRKDMCHWSRGMQIRFNLTQLEEWCRHNGLQDCGVTEAFEPIIQATQLLQVSKKSQSDVAGIFEMCTALNPLQVR